MWDASCTESYGSRVLKGLDGDAGLTEGEKEEGEKAKEAWKEEHGDDEDGEEGGHRSKSQFFTHLKQSEVRLPFILRLNRPFTTYSVLLALL